MVDFEEFLGEQRLKVWESYGNEMWWLVVFLGLFGGFFVGLSCKPLKEELD